MLENPFPFDLSVENGFLRCQKLLHAVPGRCLIIAGLWQQKPVFAKIFLAPLSGWLEFNRELRGTKALLAARIKTPVVVYAGHLKKSAAFIILFEQLNGATEFNTCLQTSTLSLERLALLRPLITTIARQHQTGIIQTDLRLKNFLLANNTLYNIDTGSIRLQKKPLSIKKSLTLLAKLFTQTNLIEAKLKTEAITWYFQLRGLALEPKLLNYINKQESYWQKKLEKIFRKKLFDSSAEFAAEKTAERFWICNRKYLTDELLALIKSPEYLFSSPNMQIIKHDWTTTVGVIRISQHQFLVKRYNIKNFWHRLKRLLTKTRAKKCWENAHRLLLRDIPTPNPVAMIEDRWGVFRGVCYFVSEYMPGVTASEYFKPHHVDLTQGYKIAQKIMNILRDLVKKKIYHGDLKASNILINQQGVWLIDLDAVQFYQTNFYFKSRAQKDNERFMRNWQGQSMIKDLFN